ncbi:MAG: (d)CMP kinase [Gemmataceae bacterium]|nr:(d)CMP kinase [Gemmataceae bacterium]
MVVTIDGPAGAGKSSAARLLARRLGFNFLDTGAMFRAVALAALQQNVDVANPAALAALIGRLRLELRDDLVLLDGADVTQAIRDPKVTAHSGAVASSLPVRQWLAQLQRSIASRGNYVCEGRDQGTVVFPDAVCKFFLVADPEERARRRWHDLLARGETVTLAEVRAAQDARDARDAARDVAPMTPAADAILLDSTGLTLEQVVDRMEHEVRKRL